MPGGDRFVLDACALLRLVQDEPGAHRVQAILGKAKKGGCQVLLHVINLGEVVYTVAKEHGWDDAQRLRAEISQLPIRIVPFSDETFWKAVELKSR